MRKTILNRKEKIIISTIELINEIGIKDLSIKEIAKKENVTEASLYKHFESKEQILIEVLEYYSKYDIHIMHTLENNQTEEKSNILKYYELYSEYYQSYPAVTSIIGCYDVLLYDEKLGNKIKEIVNLREEFVRNLIEQAQGNGSINSEVSSENLTEILFGSFDRVIFKWRMNGLKFSLKERTVDLIGSILNAYKS